MKSVTKIIFVIAIIATIVGICQINDNLDSRVHACDTLFSADVKSGERCVRAALETHNEAVNRGWGIAIVGGIFSIGALGYLYSDKESGDKKR